jgi:hypothetical protein
LICGTSSAADFITILQVIAPCRCDHGGWVIGTDYNEIVLVGGADAAANTI